MARTPRPALIAPDVAWTRLDTWALAGLLLAYLASRWGWVHDLPTSAFYWEESYRWVALQELVAGALRPIAAYQADHYQGGSLVAILLARVMAVFTGTGLVTLKLTALVFSASTLAMLYAIGRRFFGRPVGVIAAAIYLCGPPLVAFWGVCLMGFHSEGVLPSLLGVYATLALATGVWTSRAAWALSGAIATSSIWFTPTAAIAVASCALAFVVLQGLPRREALVALFPGAIVGFSPWLLYNATHGWAGIDRLVDVFVAGQSNDVFLAQSLGERALDLAARVPTEGLLDPGGVLVDPGLRGALFVGAIGPAWLGVLAGLGRWSGLRASESGASRDAVRLELVFWLYPAVFAAAYLASRFTLESEPQPIVFRLFVPPAVMMIVPMAIGAANGLARGGRDRVASAVAVGIALVSLGASTAAMAHRYEAPGAPLTRDGGYLVLGRLTQRKYPEPLDRAVAELRWIPGEADRSWASYGVGWGITEYYEQSGELAELDAFITRMSREPYVLLGMHWGIDVRMERLGAASVRTERPDLAQSLDRLARVKRKLPPVMVLVQSLEGDPSTGPASNLHPASRDRSIR